MRGDGGESQSGGDADGNFRADVEKLRPRGKALGVEAEEVEAERQVLGGITTVGVEMKGTMKLIGFADEVGVGGEGSALCVVELDAEFSSGALGVGGGGGKDAK